MEAFGLGIFMISASLLAIALESPHSIIPTWIESASFRRLLMGLGVGATAVGIIYSPWGQQSGAHLNPAVTLTFYRLGKITLKDSVFYTLFQFIGGYLGVLVVQLSIGKYFNQSPIFCIQTVPGSSGIAIAFIAEFIICFLLMLVVLYTTNHARFYKKTGLFVGFLLVVYIWIEAPLSGMSLNPARTVASALCSFHWQTLWIYFAAPLLGMFAAAEVYLWRRGKKAVKCAKINHYTDRRCIFQCHFDEILDKEKK